MPTWTVLLIGSYLAGCSDYKLSSDKGHTTEGDDTGAVPTSDTAMDTSPPGECIQVDTAPEEVGVGDNCPSPPAGGFTPIVEWDAGAGKGCLSLPVVADIDGDGLPEVIINFTDLLNNPGTLAVLEGDGSGEVWSDSNADLGYGSPPAVADIDGDGKAEIIGVREYRNSLFQPPGDYTAVAWDHRGNELWESDHFTGMDFDYATSPSISDMDHDGSPEIVLGRVILNADGTTRGVGEYGRGSYGITVVGSLSISEASVSAVADLDLDGTEEVITGNAMYDPDGNTLWYDPSQDDGMVGVANLDDDPEGEFIAITHDTVRAVDTDGSILWGPLTISSANIVSTPAIADLNGDDYPEIVVAGGNKLWCLDHNGNILWQAHAHDESGATGASIFDFEGDGVPDVVYIDEVEMMAFDGATGAQKFYSTDHASNTMFDYPTIADVDNDDHAEILVCHNGYSVAMSVFGDQDDTWAPARDLWNQHAYGISNINDDLSVPVTATPSFEDTNTWHSAIATTGDALTADVAADILDVCEDECNSGSVWVTGRVENLSADELPAGLNVALYARIGTSNTLLGTTTTTAPIPSGWTSEAITFQAHASIAKQADALWLVADDDGTGTGAIDECSETNNTVEVTGPFCQ